MKVGDLVTLSSKGSSLKGNQRLSQRNVGLWWRSIKENTTTLGVQVVLRGQRRAHNRMAWFKRYEIKKLKPPK